MIIEGLDQCYCGQKLSMKDEGMLKCREAGCETQWWHLTCVQLDQILKRWVCEACEMMKGGQGGKIALSMINADVRIPYIEMFLMTNQSCGWLVQPTWPSKLFHH
ncbi:hypothetical protein CPB84DRAFT_1684632 [Gymnopilus junonius]|uniref:Zinc finger PHD-type domain-containing protein n=1 Tax=Gymnopilus junonius TaxID=109634 RepID=A0A9P5NH37_GYMJU|nr:hypothetical protein CPB84DRAFT_1684632 [Gymnopilus junonius]